MRAFLDKGKFLTDVFFQIAGKYILAAVLGVCPAGPGQNSSMGAGRRRI